MLLDLNIYVHVTGINQLTIPEDLFTYRMKLIHEKAQSWCTQ